MNEQLQWEHGEYDNDEEVQYGDGCAIEDYHRRISRGFRPVPEWAAGTAPRTTVRRDAPTLIVISLPEDDEWYIAMPGEAEAIADPQSFIGGILRPHSSLLCMPYISHN